MPGALAGGSFAGFVTDFAFYAVFSAIISTALARIMFASSGIMLAGADRIVVLENGRVAQQGAPAQLMERGGLYRRMVELQRESARWKLGR